MRTPRLICTVFLISLFTVCASATELTWSPNQEVPGLKASQGALGAVYYQGSLHIVSLVHGGGAQHTWLTDGQWFGPTTIAGMDCHLVPTLASDGQTMHVVYEASGFSLKHSIWDGRAWTAGVTIKAMETRSSPIMTGADGVLHLAHCGMNRDANRLFHSANNGWGWTTNLVIPDQNSHMPPDLVVYEDQLHQVHVGTRTKTLWHSSLQEWGQWTPRVQVPGTESSRRPSLVVANGKLYLFFAKGNHRLGEAAEVAYIVFQDGRWSTPVTIEGYVVYGHPEAAVQKGVVDQIHLLLPTKVGVLHLQTNLEVKIAPLKTQTKTMKR